MTTDPRSVFDELLCTALAVGLVLVLLVPAARGMSAVGWLPLWLVGMPAVAWWALRGFPLPRRAVADRPRGAVARRRPVAQAARPARAVPKTRWQAAA